jgi:L-aminopeptidase/D-esterase-like protein
VSSGSPEQVSGTPPGGEARSVPGFRVGHWSDVVGRTGCTVVIPPEGARGGVDVRGGGPGTRETDVVGPLAGTDRVSAVVLAGGSAFGLAAADGVMRWLEEQGIGYPTPAGIVPIVSAAIAYDLGEGDPTARPTAESGYAACEVAREGAPQRGQVGAGTGTASGKVLGRGAATPSGVGYAAERGGFGGIVAALAVANPFGDVVGADGALLAGPRAEGAPRTVDFISSLERAPTLEELEARNTTLVCVMTDASLDKAGCARVARAASAGIARAVEPVFTDVDGDVAFCLASGQGEAAGRFELLQVQALAARVTADAIRDAVTSAGSATMN